MTDPMAPICPCCKKPGELITGREVYPHRKDLWGRMFWACAPCDTRVSCHKGSKRPLGGMVGEYTRLMRGRAHGWFDKIWQEGYMKRDRAYQWLAKAMGVDKDDCHIAMFNDDQCRQVIVHSKRLLKEKGYE